MNNISVLIPAYNSAEYIREAVDSVLAQTYPVSEIVIVDDGSTDNTGELLKEYRRLRSIKYIYQDNKGPAAARNRGIKEATGDYIAFLDSDDVWLANKIEKQIDLLKKFDYEMVYCDMSHVEDGKLIYKSYLNERSYKTFGNGNVYESLLRENFIFTPTVVVKKEIIEKIGYFDENYKICEDYKMWLKIARNYKIGFLNEPLVIRRRVSTNITEDKLLFITSGINLFDELAGENCYDRQNMAAIRKGLSERFFNLGYFYWDRGELSLARRNFLNSMKYRENMLKSLPYIILSYLPCGLINSMRRTRCQA